MTICLAIRCKNSLKAKKKCILFAADTQESSGLLKGSATKLRIIEEKTPKSGDPWRIAIASAGDAMVVDEVLAEMRFFLREKMKPQEKPSLFLQALRSEISDLVYGIYEKYKKRRLDPTFELLLGGADDFSTILYVTNEGKNQVFEQFGIIGTGRVTGGSFYLEKC